MDNVLSMTVVTGKGDLFTCSPSLRPDLFNSVLGGLGQTAVIVSVEMALEAEPASTVSTFYLVYNDRSKFLASLRTISYNSSFEGAGASIFSNTAVGRIPFAQAR